MSGAATGPESRIGSVQNCVHSCTQTSAPLPTRGTRMKHVSGRPGRTCSGDCAHDGNVAVALQGSGGLVSEQNEQGRLPSTLSRKGENKPARVFGAVRPGNHEGVGWPRVNPNLFGRLLRRLNPPCRLRLPSLRQARETSFPADRVVSCTDRNSVR